jgi:hypothetical protein
VAPGNDPIVVRSAVLAAVAAEALPLASIRAVLPSLEDVYRRAVARPAQPGAAATARHDAAAVTAATAGTRTDATARRAEAADAALPRVHTADDVAIERDRTASLEPVEPVTLPSADPREKDES